MTRVPRLGSLSTWMAGLLLGACADTPPCATHSDGVVACSREHSARRVASFPRSDTQQGTLLLATSGDDVYALEPNGTVHRYDFATGVELGSLTADAPPATRIAGGPGGVYLAQRSAEGSSSRVLFWDGVRASPEELVAGLFPVVELVADSAGAVALSCSTGLGCGLTQVTSSGEAEFAATGPGDVVGLALTPTHVAVVGGTRGAHACLVYRRDAWDAPPTIVPWDDPEADDAVLRRGAFGDGEPYVIGDTLTFVATDARGLTLLHSLDTSVPLLDRAAYASLRFSAGRAHADLASGAFTDGWDSPLSTARLHFIAPGFREADPVATLGLSYVWGGELRLVALDRARLALAVRYREFGSTTTQALELWFLDLAPTTPDAGGTL